MQGSPKNIILQSIINQSIEHVTEVSLKSSVFITRLEQGGTHTLGILSMVTSLDH